MHSKGIQLQIYIKKMAKNANKATIPLWANHFQETSEMDNCSHFHCPISPMIAREDWIGAEGIMPRYSLEDSRQNISDFGMFLTVFCYNILFDLVFKVLRLEKSGIVPCGSKNVVTYSFGFRPQIFSWRGKLLNILWELEMIEHR